MKLKFYVWATLFAFVVLAAACVWLGALNQDEGWYIYAARMVADGFVPYRDFAYTQGPVMPIVYSVFRGVWDAWGLAGARVLTLAFGAAGVFLASRLAARLAPPRVASFAAVVTALLLGCNLFHVYYITIPKTYSLATLFLVLGFYFLSFIVRTSPALQRVKEPVFSFFAGVAFAFAAGTRISMGAVMPVVGIWMLFCCNWKTLAAFCAGGFGALALVYGPFIADAGARAGLLAAQEYHAARGGFDIVWTVGSLSRLVRWYLPLFIVLGLAVSTCGFITKDRPFGRVVFLAPLTVVLLQLAAPFPYEDYQVPLMSLFAVYAAVKFSFAVDRGAVRADVAPLLVLGLSFAASFGSPLIERWMTNGQDRFWSLKKDKSELAQLRSVAAEIESLDPGGKTLLTQDTYLAVETGRTVPRGLEMGPFSVLDDAAWKRLLASADCPIAALSGYTFAVEPPRCDERPVEKQMEYWNLLKEKYELVSKEDNFGQNSTTLLILKRK